jgi:benzaldehyde dehydrogenase (NAD)
MTRASADATGLPPAKPLLDSTRWTGKVFYGEWAPARTSLVVREPATGEVLGEVGESQPDDLKSVVAAAKQAQLGWAATAAEERAALLRRAAAILDVHRRELINFVIRETGGVRGKAEMEVHHAIDELLHSAAILVHPEGHILPSRHPERLSLARRVPLGIVGVIAPWNVPMLLAMRSVAPALALGNAVILKPDPQTPIAGGVALARVFEEAGLPAGVFNVVNGGA